MRRKESKLLLKICQAYLAQLNLSYQIKHLTHLTQGVNNTCFKVETQCNKILLVKHFDKQNNFKVTEVEQGLAILNVVPKVIALNDSEKLIAYQFIEQTRFNKSTHLPSLICKLKQLHQCNIAYHFDVINVDNLLNSFSDVAEFEAYQTDISQLLSKLGSFTKTLGVCHNDLVLENLLFSNSESWIIDFEYVGLNDVYFDLAALSSSLKLNQQDRKELLSLYFEQQTITDEQLVKLTVYQKIYNFICYFWYLKHGFINHAQALLSFIKR